MELHPGPVSGELVQGHAPFLPDHDGLVASAVSMTSIVLLIRLVRVLDCTSSRCGRSHASTRPVPLPSAGEKVRAVLAAEAQVAPTRRTSGPDVRGRCSADQTSSIADPGGDHRTVPIPRPIPSSLDPATHDVDSSSRRSRFASVRVVLSSETQRRPQIIGRRQPSGGHFDRLPIRRSERSHRVAGSTSSDSRSQCSNCAPRPDQRTSTSSAKDQAALSSQPSRKRRAASMQDLPRTQVTFRTLALDVKLRARWRVEARVSARRRRGVTAV